MGLLGIGHRTKTVASNVAHIGQGRRTLASHLQHCRSWDGNVVSYWRMSVNSDGIVLRRLRAATKGSGHSRGHGGSWRPIALVGHGTKAMRHIAYVDHGTKRCITLCMPVFGRNGLRSQFRVSIKGGRKRCVTLVLGRKLSVPIVGADFKPALQVSAPSQSNPPALDHAVNLARIADIGQRIGIQQHQVGQLAGLDTAE